MTLSEILVLTYFYFQPEKIKGCIQISFNYNTINLYGKLTSIKFLWIGHWKVLAFVLLLLNVLWRVSQRTTIEVLPISHCWKNYLPRIKAMLKSFITHLWCLTAIPHIQDMILYSYHILKWYCWILFGTLVNGSWTNLTLLFCLLKFKYLKSKVP